MKFVQIKEVEMIHLLYSNSYKNTLNEKDEIMLKKILFTATLLCAATFSNAGTITLTDTVALQTTDFSKTLSFANFDTMGGTRVLESVAFSIDGSILGDIEVESRDASPSTITATLSAELTLTDALMNTLVVTIPSITKILNATAFDGVVDFGGTSGATYAGLTAQKFEQSIYTDATTLAMFTGMGSSMFTFDAEAISVATGAGGITSVFTTSAGGIIEVIYTYKEIPTQVAAPSQIALLGLGLLAIVGYRKLRK